MKRVLIYGDSNTWGHIPAKGTRYSDEIRWPGVAAELLGSEYRLIEDSISGRTTIWEDPTCPMRCGSKNLGYSMLAHAPIDLFVLALGANDLKFTDADGVVRGVSRIIDMVRGADILFNSFSPIFRGNPEILVISPSHIADEIKYLRPGHSLQYASEESKLLFEKYERMASEKNVYLLNAEEYAKPSLEDCIHYSPEDHKRLGIAIAAKIKEILE